MKKLKDKFLPAFHGLKDGFKHQSIRIQFLLGFFAIVAGILLELSTVEWLVVFLCISIVIAMEFLNTSIERLADLYSTEQDERIRVIKDVSAAAVLISCLGSAVCAFFILWNHLH